MSSPLGAANPMAYGGAPGGGGDRLRQQQQQQRILDYQQQVQNLEATVSSLMSIVSKGAEERDALAAALRAATSGAGTAPLLEAGPHQHYHGRSGGHNRAARPHDTSLGSHSELDVDEEEDEDYIGGAGDFGESFGSPFSRNGNGELGGSSQRRIAGHRDPAANGGGRRGGGLGASVQSRSSPGARSPKHGDMNNMSRSGASGSFARDPYARPRSPYSRRLSLAESIAHASGRVEPHGVGYRSPYAQEKLRGTSPSKSLTLHSSPQHPQQQGHESGGNSNNRLQRMPSSSALVAAPSSSALVASPTMGMSYRALRKYDKLDPHTRDYLLNLEVENKSLKKEVTAMSKDLRKKESETEHHRILLSKRIAYAEEAAQSYATQVATLEAELIATKLRYQDATQQLSRLVAQQPLSLAQPSIQLGMSVAGGNFFSDIREASDE